MQMTLFIGNQKLGTALSRRIEGDLESTTIRAASNVGANDDCC